MKRALPLALLALFVVAAGVYWSQRSPSASPAVVRDKDQDASGVRPDKAALSTLDAPDAARSAVALEALAAEGMPAAIDEERAAWISGRVVFPAGTPPDPTLAIVAVSGAAVVEADGDLTRAEIAARTTGAVRTSAPVAANGSFRIVVPRDGVRSALWIDGRFLRLERCALVELAAIPLDVRLDAQLAAHVEITLAPPLGAATDELAGTTISGWAFDERRMFRGGGRGGTRREVVWQEGRSVELRGLPADTRFFASAKSANFVDASDYEVRLPAGTTTVLELVLERGVEITGRVVDAEGAGVSGAEVRVLGDAPQGRRGGMGMFMGGGEEEETLVTSASDGTFRARGISPGKVDLRARGAGHPDARIEDLEVPASGLSDVELVLGPGAVVRGVVRWPDGAPARGANIVAVPLRGEREQRQRAESDAAGRFVLRGLPVGEVRLRAEIDGRARDGAPPPPPPAADESEAPFGGSPFLGRVRDDEDSPARPPARHRFLAARSPLTPTPESEQAPEVELVLEAPLEIACRVLDEDGSPYEVGKFTAFAEPVMGSGSFADAFELGGSGQVVQEVDGAPAGRFALGGLRAGTWLVRVETEEHLEPEQGVEVVVPASEEVTISLVRGAGISGIVVDPEGTPIAGADVRVVPAGEGGPMRFMFAGGRGEKTDDGGVFTHRGLKAGTADVLATHDDWAASAPVTVDLVLGEVSRDVVVTLRRGGTLAGTVYDDDGRPEGGRGIQAWSVDAASNDAAVSRSDGTFLIEHLPPGTYQVVAEPSKRDIEAMMAEQESGEGNPMAFMSRMDMTSVEIREGETTEVTIGEPPRAPVRLYGVVRNEGRPVEQGTIFALPEGGKLLDGFKPTGVKADGTYELTLNEPGDIVIVYQSEAFENEGIRFHHRVPEVSEFRLDLDLPLGGIAGRVLGPDGRPLANETVWLSEDGSGLTGLLSFGGGPNAESAEDGTFRFAHLQPGEYSLRAGGSGFGPFVSASADYGRTVVTGIVVVEGETREGIQLQLSGPGSVSGVVKDLEGRVVRDAAVFVRDADGRILDLVSPVQTDGNGRFTYPGITPGAVQVSARTKEAVSPAEVDTVVREGATSEVALTVDTGTVLRVQAEDAAGTPLRVRLSVVDENGREHIGLIGADVISRILLEGVSTSDLEVGPLAAGTYTVTATTPDGRSERKKVNLRGQDERRLKLRFDD